MAFKAIVFCVSALLVQNISGQCLRNAGIAGDIGLAGAGLVADHIAIAGPGLLGAGLVADRVDLTAPGWTGAGLVADRVGLGAPGLAWNAGLGGAIAADLAIPTHGGLLPISSASPISPHGISVVSENAIDGALAVAGNLPFLGAVATDGTLPAAGSGTVVYGCGNGIIGIEKPIGAGIGLANEVILADGLGLGAGHIGYGPGVGLTKAYL